MADSSGVPKPFAGRKFEDITQEERDAFLAKAMLARNNKKSSFPLRASKGEMDQSQITNDASGSLKDKVRHDGDLTLTSGISAPDISNSPRNRKSTKADRKDKSETSRRSSKRMPPPVGGSGAASRHMDKSTNESPLSRSRRSGRSTPDDESVARSISSKQRTHETSRRPGDMYGSGTDTDDSQERKRGGDLATARGGDASMSGSVRSSRNSLKKKPNTAGASNSSSSKRDKDKDGASIASSSARKSSGRHLRSSPVLLPAAAPPAPAGVSMKPDRPTSRSGSDSRRTPPLPPPSSSIVHVPRPSPRSPSFSQTQTPLSQPASSVATAAAAAAGAGAAGTAAVVTNINTNTAPGVMGEVGEEEEEKEKEKRKEKIKRHMQRAADMQNDALENVRAAQAQKEADERLAQQLHDQESGTSTGTSTPNMAVGCSDSNVADDNRERRSVVENEGREGKEELPQGNEGKGPEELREHQRLQRRQYRLERSQQQQQQQQQQQEQEQERIQQEQLLLYERQQQQHQKQQQERLDKERERVVREQQRAVEQGRDSQGGGIVDGGGRGGGGTSAGVVPLGPSMDVDFDPLDLSDDYNAEEALMAMQRELHEAVTAEQQQQQQQQPHLLPSQADAIAGTTTTSSLPCRPSQDKDLFRPVPEAELHVPYRTLSQPPVSHQQKTSRESRANPEQPSDATAQLLVRRPSPQRRSSATSVSPFDSISPTTFPDDDVEVAGRGGGGKSIKHLVEKFETSGSSKTNSPHRHKNRSSKNYGNNDSVESFPSSPYIPNKATAAAASKHAVEAGSIKKRILHIESNISSKSNQSSPRGADGPEPGISPAGNVSSTIKSSSPGKFFGDSNYASFDRVSDPAEGEEEEEEEEEEGADFGISFDAIYNEEDVVEAEEEEAEEDDDNWGIDVATMEDIHDDHFPVLHTLASSSNDAADAVDSQHQHHPSRLLLAATERRMSSHSSVASGSSSIGGGSAGGSAFSPSPKAAAAATGGAAGRHHMRKKWSGNSGNIMPSENPSHSRNSSFNHSTLRAAAQDALDALEAPSDRNPELHPSSNTASQDNADNDKSANVSTTAPEEQKDKDLLVSGNRASVKQKAMEISQQAVQSMKEKEAKEQQMMKQAEEAEAAKKAEATAAAAALEAEAAALELERENARMMVARVTYLKRSHQMFRQNKRFPLKPIAEAFPSHTYIGTQWKSAVAEVDNLPDCLCISIVLPHLAKAVLTPIKGGGIFRKTPPKVLVEGYRLYDDGDEDRSPDNMQYKAEFALAGMTQQLHQQDLSYDYCHRKGLLIVYVRKVQCAAEQLYVRKKGLDLSCTGSSSSSVGDGNSNYNNSNTKSGNNNTTNNSNNSIQKEADEAQRKRLQKKQHQEQQRFQQDYGVHRNRLISVQEAHERKHAQRKSWLPNILSWELPFVCQVICGHHRRTYYDPNSNSNSNYTSSSSASSSKQVTKVKSPRGAVNSGGNASNNSSSSSSRGGGGGGGGDGKSSSSKPRPQSASNLLSTTSNDVRSPRPISSTSGSSARSGSGKKKTPTNATTRTTTTGGGGGSNGSSKRNNTTSASSIGGSSSSTNNSKNRSSSRF